MATNVLPSPVAISAIRPECKTIPPINCTSNGIISHKISCPRTRIRLFSSVKRRQQFFTTANASGNN